CQPTAGTPTSARPGSPCQDNAARPPIVPHYRASFCRAFLTSVRTIHADHVAVAYRIGRYGYRTSHEPLRGIDRSQPLALCFREHRGGNTRRWLQQGGDGVARQRTLATGTAEWLLSRPRHQPFDPRLVRTCLPGRRAQAQKATALLQLGGDVHTGQQTVMAD